MDPISKFNLNARYQVFLVGEPHLTTFIGKILKTVDFLAPKAGTPGAGVNELHFLVVAADLSAPASWPVVARAVAGVSSPRCRVCLYMSGAQPLSQEVRLFCQEVGAHFVAAGPARNDQLKDYLKTTCVEAAKTGSLDGYAAELEAAMAAQDRELGRQLLERLRKIDGESEELLRLVAATCIFIHDLRRAESTLKRLLLRNSQNLWAANQLGRLLLTGGRVGEGIEILSRLSQFHELNPERCLALGDAYVRAGLATEAESTYQKGARLTQGADDRFKDGVAKVRLLDNDLKGALAALGSTQLSAETLTFLNMRAVMAVRAGRFAEGLTAYQTALTGTTDQIIRAKLFFNMGLAYVRGRDLDKARDCLESSAVAGGDRFRRARTVLETVNQVARRQQAAGGNQAPADAVFLDDVAWETLY